MGLLEAARASWWHSMFLRGAGAKIGRGVYFDTITFSVSNCTMCWVSLMELPLTLKWPLCPACFLLTLPRHASIQTLGKILQFCRSPFQNSDLWHELGKAAHADIAH